MMNHNVHLVVAALQIGATHSGFAYSLKSDFEKDPLKIHSHTWIANSRSFLTLTVPTSLLFSSDESLYAFGYEAEDKYTELIDDQEHHGWYFFRLDLSDDQIFQKGLTFKAVNGMVMGVEEVLSKAYRYLKDFIMKKFHEIGIGLSVKDVYWVLTSRNQSAVHVQCIRRAAEKAGFMQGKISIVQEYESALHYCRYSGHKKGGMILPGQKCMVLDCRESAVDLQLFAVKENSTYKELESVNKVAEGGQMFKKEFIGVMEKIVGDQTMQMFKKGNPSDILDFMRLLEVKMRMLTFEATGKITFKLPFSLIELCEEVCGENIDKMIQKSVYADCAVMRGDKLAFVSDFLINMCKRTSELILHNVMKQTLNVKYRDLNKIIIIGKYANFKILQQTISKAFEGKGVEVITLDDPELAVLKGACIFGHTPQNITVREPRLQRLTPDMEQSVHEKAQTSIPLDDWSSCMNKEHGSAKWKCINCGDYMCEHCKNTHMMGKKTRKHYMLHIGERDKEETAHWEVFCRKHVDKELDMYCITDKQAICTICSMSKSHSGHETVTYEKYANRIRSDLGLAVTKADKIFPQYNKTIEELDKKIPDAKSMTQTNLQRIDSYFQGIISKLKENAENCKAEEKRKMEVLGSSVASELEDMKKKRTDTKTAILDARRFLENCSERQLIREAANHTERLKMIKAPKSVTASHFPAQLEWDEIQRKLTKNLFVSKP